MDIPYKIHLKRGLVILILAIAGAAFVAIVSSEYGSNRIDAANFYTSTVLSLLLVWVYLNISDIQSQQVELDKKQTRLMERQNRLQSVGYEPDLDVHSRNCTTENSLIKFENVENQGNGIAFGLNLKISPSSSPNVDSDLQPYRINPQLGVSDFRGYIRPDESATVYFEVPDEIDDVYIKELERLQIEFEYTNAAGEIKASGFFYQVATDENHTSLTDFFD